MKVDNSTNHVHPLSNVTRNCFIRFSRRNVTLNVHPSRFCLVVDNMQDR